MTPTPNRWALPTNAELDAFLALTIVQRGERLAGMPASQRIAYACAYARRDGCGTSRACDRFDAWRNVYLDSLQVAS